MFYRADFILQGHDWIEDGALEVQDDQILQVGPVEDLIDPSDAPDVTDLGHVALVPGQVNAHSHAFQRAIRGRTEYVSVDRQADDFWSWREAMYEAVLSLDADAFESACRRAFEEMALTGYTTVGEFHYVHHRPDGTPYDDPNELAYRAIDAARDVGLRISLLRVAYNRAGYDKSPNPRQRRFIESDVDTYLQRFDALTRSIEERRFVSVGMAPHSIRAVPQEWLEAISAHGHGQDVPMHIHACEQPGEVAESMDEYDKPPLEALESMGLLDDRVTIIHGTHLSEGELGILADRQPTICACPTTERNLGDGFLPATELMDRGVPICLGSDSHANIDPFEEMRLVEYHERLQKRRRNVLASYAEPRAVATDPGGSDRLSTAEVCWEMGTRHGARALGLPGGELLPGRLADFTALDLDHISLRGADAESLLPSIVFSMTPGAVRDVFVGGEAIVRDGGLTSS